MITKTIPTSIPRGFKRYSQAAQEFALHEMKMPRKPVEIEDLSNRVWCLLKRNGITLPEDTDRLRVVMADHSIVGWKGVGLVTLAELHDYLERHS